MSEIGDWQKTGSPGGPQEKIGPRRRLNNLAGILAARGREVDWSEIVAEIAREVGHPVNERTVRTYVADLRNPVGPAKLKGEPRVRCKSTPEAVTPALPNMPAAPIQKDSGTRAAPNARRDFEMPGSEAGDAAPSHLKERRPEYDQSKVPNGDSGAARLRLHRRSQRRRREIHGRPNHRRELFVGAEFAVAPRGAAQWPFNPTSRHQREEGVK